jgi:hypothetical protein
MALPALAVFRTQSLKINLSLIYLHLLTASFLYHVVPKAFLKSIDQELAWKSGYKVPLLPLGPSGPLQAILLVDPVRWQPAVDCNGCLALIFYLEVHQTATIVCGMLSHSNQRI